MSRNKINENQGRTIPIRDQSRDADTIYLTSLYIERVKARLGKSKYTLEEVDNEIYYLEQNK